VSAQRRRLGRGGAPAGARDQEPADADPAVGRAAAAQARAKLAGADQSLLLRSVATIVSQVQAMQQLVNEFRDYARLPAAQMKPLDLNPLVHRGAGAVRARAGPRPPGPSWRSRPAADQRRRHAAAPGDPQPGAERAGRGGRADHGHVEVHDQRALGEHGELRAVRLTVIDNGPGFADKVLKRAFEPYVTTKAKGTGLGLAVVKKIADEHRARLRVVNLHRATSADGCGDRCASFAIIFQFRTGASRGCRTPPPQRG
jgi:nitrogen fixation/metabolism regulation signal transduction histidine kinase